MPVVVVATIFPLPGEQAAVIDAIRAIVPLVHEEEGCELYALHQNHDTLVMVEQWSSRESLASHSTGRALAMLGPTIDGRLVRAAEVVVLDPLPSGQAIKGVVRPG